MKIDTLPLRPAPATAHLPHVVIVGGGASGVLLAAHLLRDPAAPLRVTVIEGRHMLGCGVAYSTADPGHLLNTRVANMSAFPDDPDHFRRWLAACGHEATGASFVSRTTYGAYLTDLLAPLSADGRLHCIRAGCTRLATSALGVVAHLDDGQTVTAGTAVLATGHAVPEPDPEGLVLGAWEPAPPPPPGGRVVIIGSGLSMIDQAISLMSQGHRGEIVAISRRAQLPRIHATGLPLPVARAEVPLGAPVSALMSWLRGLVAQAEAQGGTWRDAIDGIRPHLSALWRAMPTEDRARFLRHAAPWWEVHRHRLPPESAAPIHLALRTGRMRQLAGSFLGASRDGAILRAHWRPRGQEAALSLDASRIVDCRGIRRDPQVNATPLIADLLASGRARIDPLRLGLDVAPDCAVIDAEGRPDPRLRAIGPTSRAAFWEITAIPDIREQARTLAAELTRQLAAG
ncbi:FAD-dependent oxidoreductase (plasmid) [Paracoccus liaowanqingii]|uniref:FAD-dependent oxidoreductase n=1 Tax=Paracoccus liaowanqingii TaxID=2560053 RepID=A0A4Y5SSM7_9RHOB|nr:FAD/NAD(P)-binding protein [Paracoccus liaowanqingii]QDA36507.1 FAD-dependent oxidoreductase [Paracoccus liaowanqingii]